MYYFDKYTSASAAAVNNQAKYTIPDGNVRVSRTYEKSQVTADSDFSVLLGDTVDSTFEDGSVCRANMVCGNWEVKWVRIGVTEEVGSEPDEMFDVTIEGEKEKKVSEGEVFSTDPVRLCVNKGQYFCIEIAYCGKEIPILFETVISSYNKGENGWYRDIFLPVPNMVGCSRENVTRIGFWGDSITQGICTEQDSYTHYGAVVADTLGDDFAYWDLGIGYARASDAASCGAWLNKAKQNDIVTVCFGINDINAGSSTEKLESDLNTIVTELKNAGCKVIIQSIPPFDYTGEYAEIWNEVNSYIRNELSKKCDGYFDNNAILCDKEIPENQIYGQHPNAEGHLLWGKALAELIKEIADK